jgi:WNK lysine deficient protein kinase
MNVSACSALMTDTQCRHRRTIDFAYDPDVDTPEEIADEITSEFALSSTDRDICAAALKEWLAKELPDNGSS